MAEKKRWGMLMFKKSLLLIVFLLSAPHVYADYAKGKNAIDKKEFTIAAQELEKPVADGDPKAEHLMGTLYFNGQGVAQNDEKAFALFRSATEKGNLDAKAFLGYMYDAGRGVKQDKKKAFDLYKEASDAGNDAATVNMGILYYKGDGVAQSYEKAFQLFTSVGDYKNPTLFLYLGHLYNYGYDVRQDINKAVEYYSKAAALGDVNAHYILGGIYQKGRSSIVPDATEALKFYMFAAQSGHAESQYNLATLYASGATGTVDRVQAHAWLLIAASQKLDVAVKMLKQFENTMTLDERTKSQNYAQNIFEKQGRGDEPISPVPLTIVAPTIVNPTVEEGNQNSAAVNTPSTKKRRAGRMIRRR